MKLRRNCLLSSHINCKKIPINKWRGANLCCNFCKVKECINRCKNDHKKCGLMVEVSDDGSSAKE